MRKLTFRFVVAVGAFTCMVPWLWRRCWQGAAEELARWEQINLDNDVLELSEEGLERLWADIAATLAPEVDEDERGPRS